MSASRMPAAQQSITLHLTFETESLPLLRDVTSVLYGLELLHDLVVLSTSDRYQNYSFDDRFFHRSGRPIEPSELLRVGGISLAPPLTIELQAVPVAALATVLVIVEKVRFWKLDRQMVEAEIARLRREVDRLDYSDRDLLRRFERATESEAGNKIVRGILGGMESISDRIRVSGMGFLI
ncbi:hypothetical protein KQH82_06845 [bacterium]|nr:hypothetical protein [bacterium]